MTKKRSSGDDLRAAGRLAVSATTGVTEVVEEMHRTIAAGPEILGAPLEGVVRVLTRLAYGRVRAVTRFVGNSLDLALTLLAPLLGERAPGPVRETAIAVLNGIVGDHLSATGNALAIPMQLRHHGHALQLERERLSAALPAASGKVLLLAHGSAMSDRQWRRHGHDHGAALAHDLGYTPIYLRYNSGLHISTNGRELAALLEELVSQWPLPVEELVMLGFSMGGLVLRSACHVAEDEGHAWRRALSKLVFLGAPHHGAPLERGGSLLEGAMGVSRYSAPLARLAQIRSAGVTDLRYGNVLDEHWDGRDRFARAGDTRRALSLPAGVQCYAVAGTIAPAIDDELPGDGIVPVDSALGRHQKPDLTLAFPPAHCLIATGTTHLDLLDKPEVYSAIRTWLGSVEAPRDRQ